MPLDVNYAAAVLFFGDDACDHSADLIRTLGLALSKTAWSRFVFVRSMTQGAKRRDLERRPGLVGFDESFVRLPNGSVQVASDLIRALRGTLGAGQLRIHCIVSSHAGNPVPGDFPVRCALAVAQVFSVTQVPIYIHTLLSEDEDARREQNALASAMLNPPAYASFLPYFYTATYENGGEVGSYAPWRSIAWLILHNSIVTNVPAQGVYAVGYNAINANDRELTLLREHAVCEKLAGLSRAPITEREAWRLLTDSEGDGGAQPRFESPEEMREETHRWLMRRVDAALPQPTQEELDMLRILCAADSAGDADDALCAFYGCNTAVPEDRPDDTRYPGVFVRESILGDMRRHLASAIFALPNLEQFPLSALHSLIAALTAIAKQPLPELDGSAPREGVFSRFGPMKTAYVRKCIAARHDSARERYVHLVCRSLTGPLKKMYSQLLLALTRIKDKQTFTRRLQEKPDDQISLLKEKYPDYTRQIAGSLSSQIGLFGNDWDRNASLVRKAHSAQPLYGPTGAMDEAQYRRLIDDAMDRIDASRSFIAVINSEYPNTQKMHEFINAYMPMPRAMMSMSGMQQTEETIVYLLDENLQNHPWAAAANRGARYALRNDNVERVCVYRQGFTLPDLVQGNPCIFGNLFIPLPQNAHQTAGHSIAWNSDARSDAADAREDAGESEAPVLITARPNSEGTAVEVAWVWPENAEKLYLRVNGGSAIACKRSSLPGITLTKATAPLRVGCNRVALYLTAAAGEDALYAQTFVSGLIQRVGVEAGGSTLTITVPGRDNFVPEYDRPEDRARLWEEDARFQLALMIRRPGAEPDAPCMLFPVCLPQVGHTDTVCRFEGLRLRGSGQLVRSPNYRYHSLLSDPALRL